MILVGSGIFFNGYVWLGDTTYAQETTLWAITNDTTNTSSSTSGVDTMSLRQILNMLLKAIYLLLWPLLVIAGLALDNTLVYASIFHLDAPLWKFWNMMKNFANFALGFMVLFAIIKSIITNSGQWSFKDEKSPLGIIKTTLIAWVLIQASRFLLAALVDISTITTYAVGGLPLSILKNTDIGQQKILSINSSIDLDKFDLLNEEGESFKVWYSTTYHDTNKNIDIPVVLSPCRVEDNFVVGRQYTDAKYRNPDVFGDEIRACVVGGNQIVLYNEFPHLINKEGIAYKNGIDDMLGLGVADVLDEWQSCGYIVSLTTSSPLPWACGTRFNDIYSYLSEHSDAYTLEDYTWLSQGKTPTTTPANHAEQLGQNWWTTRFHGEDIKAITISDLISRSKWFVWPLVTIYASLLNFAELTAADTSASIGETSGIFIIKSLVAIALFFPLLALAVVLIARIGILRLYIVASPFIVLKSTFSKFMEGKGMDALNKYLSLTSVIKIVFAPVVTVAALSISLIFMTALSHGFQSSSTSDSMLSSLWLAETKAVNGDNYDAIQFQNFGTVEFSKLPRGDNGLDWFSWLLVNFFAIGLMRMIFFAALNANELGASIGNKIKTFGEWVFRTMPILPIWPNGEKVWIGSASKVISALPERYIDKRVTDQEREMNEKLDKKFGLSQESDTTPPAPTTQSLTTIMTQPTVTKESIREPFTTPWATEQTITNTINTPTNVALLYNAWSGITDAATQTTIKQRILDAGVTPANWNTAVNNAKIATATQNLATFIGTPSTQADLNTLLATTDAANKKILDDYFALQSSYVVMIWTQSFTITKNTAGTYTSALTSSS